MLDKEAYFECLGKDLANVLLAEVASRAKAILDLRLFAVSLGRTTSGTGTDGATENFWPPPPVYGTFRVMKAEYRIRVSESPSVRGLGETGYYV